MHEKAAFSGGTLDYLAPEVVAGLPHDASIDIWCLGVLLYELLHGQPPFSGKSESEKVFQIKNYDNKLVFNEEISGAARHLISALMKKRPSERITMKQIFEDN